MEKVIVSACLLGENCKYNGKNNKNDKVLEFIKDKQVIPICPEVFGGLSTPRVPSEIKGNTVVNKDGIDVTKEEMKKIDAIKSGAECMFIEKYPDIVTVYSIGNISKELCGGPHVTNTCEIGEFKIIKEESSSSGVRRIKAIIK